MVRTCQVADTIQEYADVLLQARAKSEVGLLLGRLGVGSKDIVLLTCKSPPKDGEEPFQAATTAGNSKKGVQKGKSSVSASLDDEWVAEHALQVSRMLLGGIKLIGLYLFGPEGALQQCVKQVLQLLDSFNDVEGAVEDSPWLVLLMDNVAGGCTMKEVLPCANGVSDLKPCQLKFVPKLADSFVLARGRYGFSTSFLIPSSATLGSKLLHDIMAGEQKRVAEAVGVVGETSAADGTSVATAMNANRPPDAEAHTLYVELLAPPPGLTCDADRPWQRESGAMRGRVLMSGVIEAAAVVHKHESTATAVRLLKEDVCCSLMTRKDLVLEDSEEGGARSKDREPSSSLTVFGDGRKLHHISLPHRVLIRLQEGHLALCDYLMKGEGVEQTVEHVKELLSLELDPSKEVLQVEEESDQLEVTGEWRPSLVGQKSWSPGSEEKPKKGQAGVILLMLIARYAWLFIVVVALIVAVLGTRRDF